MTVKLTSISALRDLEASGKGDTQRADVLRAVLHTGNLTRQEISHETGLPINAICGRVNELVKSQSLEVGPERICRITGRRVETITIIPDACDQYPLFGEMKCE